MRNHRAKVRFLYFAAMNSINAKDYFVQFAQKLTNIYDDEEARAIAGYVCAELLFIKWHQLKVIEKLLSEAEKSNLDTILNRLIQGEPLQYVLGYTWFYGLKFQVDKSVLIPRPETEELVEIVINYCNQNNIKSPTIIDLGTGSGCIPVSLKKNLPTAQVFGVDIMDNALVTAKNNAFLNKADVSFIKADMLDLETLTQQIKITQHPVVLISNPPYIAQNEADKMHLNVLKHEPREALFVPDNDALKFYKAIVTYAKQGLNKGDIIWLEINPLFADDTLQLFSNAHFYQSSLIKDLTGKLRFLNTVI